ncbi:MAG: hypothetical protein A2Y15_07425 [Clostridiales bacterium GWF2_36_10]|nr:MAG: hypothetical protein A2Y15_07425 [Clostridiales bacterium GWF2_36_10]
MRIISTFFYHIGQSFIGIFRNGVMSIASTLILVSCMIILGTFYVVIDNIDTNFKMTDDINLIKIYLPDNLSQEQIDEVEDELIKINDELGNIEEYKYYTKKENLEKFKNSTKLPDNLFPKDNPLPNSYEIKFTPFSDENFDIELVYKLQERLGNIKYISPDDIKENIDLYDKVNSINNTLTVIGAGMMGILLIISLFVIMNTIKLGMHSRRNEIMFMRYCGATKSFIRTPFIIEGIIIGIVSAGVAFGLQYYLYDFVIKDFITGQNTSVLGETAETATLLFTPFNEYVKLILIAFLGIGLFAGIISSSISIKKYLKV